MCNAEEMSEKSVSIANMLCFGTCVGIDPLERVHVRVQDLSNLLRL